MIRDHQKNNLFSSHFIKLEPKNHVFGTKRRKTKQQRDKTSQESELKQKKIPQSKGIWDRIQKRKFEFDPNNQTRRWEDRQKRTTKERSKILTDNRRRGEGADEGKIGGGGEGRGESGGKKMRR